MSTNRLLLAINLSIAGLLAAFLVACYWYGFRPLAETTGQITAPISGPGMIRRDALGVPHIQAESSEDAIFLQGYAMAQDRLWQMDAMRRRAAGELAEVVGERAVALDKEARAFGLRRIAQAAERDLQPEERTVFAAFARGVNHYIDTHRGRLPLEFTLLNYDPRPWSVRDCVLAGLEMYRSLTQNWRTELIKQKMRKSGDAAKVDFLFPLGADAGAQPGSNAWVISGARTASGKPILSNDPHLEYALPSPWYLVQLDAPDLHVTGASIIGLPTIVTGHNQSIAWGVTNLEFDVQDLYREQFDQQTGRYQYDGAMQQAQAEQDVISVKGAAAQPIVTWYTRHGPIFAMEDGQAYALHWSAAEQGGFTFPFLAVNRAQNWVEFKNALSRLGGPALNFVYADISGNIGYQVAGRLPKRKNCAGDLPADGATPDCEWDGSIPFEELPSSYNPPSGVLVTANNNPFPKDFPYKVNGNFATTHRVWQITSRLKGRDKWKAEEMVGVQIDAYSAFSHRLAQQTIAAFDAEKPNAPDLSAAVEVLRAWGGTMQKGQAAPMLATLIYEQLRQIVADRAAAGQSELYRFAASVQAIEQLLQERPKNWFPDYDALMMRALRGALEAGAKLQGSNVSRWDFGQYQPLRIQSPVGGNIPLVGRLFNLGPVAFSGSPTSVVQYTGRLGPSLRMTTDLSDLEHSFANLVTGESGQRFSTHYKDQWDAYLQGRTFAMPFNNVNAKDVLSVNPSQ